ncbi:MAG: M50 family metallopeptidase [Kofleriaceae bacterium]
MNPRLALAAVVAIATNVAARSDAHAEPSDRELVLVGLALAPPTYLAGVTLHEGSHALAAKLVGAEVVDMRLFPPGREPRTGKFRFGWTYVRGLEGRGEKVWFYAAPKVTDAVLLGGFAALVLTDAWPHNRYGQLALTVVATGLWIDFSKDVLAFSRHNDVVKVFDLWCLTGWRQLPARLIYAGAVVGIGLVVARGYQRTFEDPVAQQSTLLLPILASTF